VNISHPSRDSSQEAAFAKAAWQPDESVMPAAGSCSFRPFGRNREDLDFNFAADDRPRLVTEILSACMFDKDALPLDTANVWKLSISRRIACLLRLAAMGDDFSGQVTVQCPGVDCGQVVEMDLPIPEILALQQRVEERALLELRDGPEPVRLRRPTGVDQIRWRGKSFLDPEDAREAMVSNLISGPDDCAGESTGGTCAISRVDFTDSLESKLEEFDPLTAFSIRIHCPNCAVETDFAVDLEGFALKALEKTQQRLMRDVHRMASTYHWSEEEIFRLSPQRRERYLKLIEEEAR
jgi:hypothetical protein